MSYEIEIDSSMFDHLGKARINKGRASEVVMVIPRPGGRILVNTKRFYPAGVFRLLTGGIKLGEDPEKAFLREVKEETGLSAEVDRYLGRIDYDFIYGDERQNFASHVFLAKPTTGEFKPEDDKEEITEFRGVTLMELEEIACKLESLGEIAPEWASWGKFRAIAHRFVLEKTGGLAE